jgi:hypothetical protein
MNRTLCIYQAKFAAGDSIPVMVGRNWPAKNPPHWRRLKMAVVTQLYV